MHNAHINYPKDSLFQNPPIRPRLDTYAKPMNKKRKG